MVRHTLVCYLRVLQMIKSCANCKPHAYQDSKYGKNMRVYTMGVKKEHKSKCTVCGKELSVSTKK